MTQGRLTKVTNEADEVYHLLRDSEGDLEKETDFDGITRDYERDYTGRVLSVTLNGKYTTSYAYDDMDRMVRITRPGGSEENYGYDVSGLLTEAVNADAEVSFERDIMGRIIKESSNGHVINSAYNLQGRRTRLTSTLGADIEAPTTPLATLKTWRHRAGWQDSGTTLPTWRQNFCCPVTSAV